LIDNIVKFDLLLRGKKLLINNNNIVYCYKSSSCNRSVTII